MNNFSLELSKFSSFIQHASFSSDFALKVEKLRDLVQTTFNQDKLIAICGNGGSMTDSMHFAAELTVRYKTTRKAINSIALGSDPAFTTACANDFGFEKIFARHLEAVARQGDLLICLSTSGRSQNVLYALNKAKSIGCHTAVMCGSYTHEVENIADLVVDVPSVDTAIIQSCHRLVYHWVVESVEDFMSS